MYRRRTTRAGKTLEIEKYTCTRMECGKRVRGPKRNPTPEDMKAVNERNAQRRLTWIINENFSPGDIHMILTYQDPAPEKEEAKTERSKFIRELRKIYKKAGTELKYITVTEYHGKRIHHHLLLSAIDTRLLRGAWARGRPKITFLDESGSYWRLAGYFRKELRRTGEAGEKKRICTSRNLKRPEPECREISAKSFRKEPAAKIRHKGAVYYPDASRPWEKYIDEVTGYEHYIFYYRRL